MKYCPQVSVILPVRNGGTFLLLAVKSILNQTLQDFELLVIDDGSTDNAVENLQFLNDKRVRLIVDGQKRGLAARLNEGILMSAGEYIARMDADDLAMPRRLSVQKTFLDLNHGVDLVSSKVVAFRGDELIDFLPFRERHEEITQKPWSGVYMPHPTWMGRKAWFRKFTYHVPEFRLAEDQELLLRAMHQSIYYSIPEVLLAYNRTHSGLQKKILARRGLLLAQIKVFGAKKQYLAILLSVFNFIVKAAFDLVWKLIGFIGIKSLKRKTEFKPEMVNQFLELRNPIA